MALLGDTQLRPARSQFVGVGQRGVRSRACNDTTSVFDGFDPWPHAREEDVSAEVGYSLDRLVSSKLRFGPCEFCDRSVEGVCSWHSLSRDAREVSNTTSKKRADLFDRIPKIQFTDSGHGIVFAAREHRGPRKPTRRMDYVYDQLLLLNALSNAPRVLRDHIDQIEKRAAQAQAELVELRARVGVSGREVGA